jgi:hypothetical protein
MGRVMLWDAPRGAVDRAPRPSRVVEATTAPGYLELSFGNVARFPFSSRVGYCAGGWRSFLVATTLIALGSPFRRMGRRTCRNRSSTAARRMQIEATDRWESR